MQKQFQIAINKNIVSEKIRSGINNSGLRMHRTYYRGAPSSPYHNISENFTIYQYPEPIVKSNSNFTLNNNRIYEIQRLLIEYQLEIQNWQKNLVNCLIMLA